MSSDTLTRPAHPSPHRERAPLWRQLAGLCAAPLAWFVQFTVGYALTSYACFPGDRALGQVLSGWDWTRGAAVGINLLAAAVAVWAGWISLGVWRVSREEKEGRSEHVIEAGEGRTRFFGLWGMMTSAGFLVAIVFDTVMALGAAACRG